MSNKNRAEEEHWHNVLRTFLHYEEFFSYDLERRQERINKLPAKYADRLPNITFEKLGGLQHAANENQFFFEDMVHFHASATTQDENGHPVVPRKSDGLPIHIKEQHRNQAVLHSLYREWSEEGALERNSTFKVLLDELKLRLPVDQQNAYQQKVVVPGCGLGRLPLEIAAAGYACQGNEFSA
jgi:carnosine N-methyltransferase